jgi:hypothetical protein
LTAPNIDALSVDKQGQPSGVDEEGVDIFSAFVEPKSHTAGLGKSGRIEQKKKPLSESLIALNKALEEAQQESRIDRNVPGKGTVRVVQVADVRSSFARHYRPKGGGNKGADAQRQAFTRAMKAILEEGAVKQGSWDGVDWLWRHDE